MFCKLLKIADAFLCNSSEHIHKGCFYSSVLATRLKLTDLQHNLCDDAFTCNRLLQGPHQVFSSTLIKRNHWQRHLCISTATTKKRAPRFQTDANVFAIAHAFAHAFSVCEQLALYCIYHIIENTSSSQLTAAAAGRSVIVLAFYC
jgi:hypothetical protein